MQMIYQIGRKNIFEGVTRLIEDDAGAPVGWTFSRPADVPAGEFALFSGPDWIILDEYPTTPEAPVAPAVPASQDATAGPAVM